MQEHEKTIEIIRNDIIEEIREILYGDSDIFKGTDIRMAIYAGVYELNIFDTATTLQLRAFLRLLKKGNPSLRVVRAPIGSDPYMAVTFSGIYVGIEPDGYTHS